MYLTEKLAISLGKKARTILKTDKEKEEILVYGAINLLQTIFSIAWVIIAGAILGVLYEALIFSVSMSILRKYSGGFHASSPNRCIIGGTISAATAGLLVDKFFYKFSFVTTLIMIITFMIIAFIIVSLKAPVDSPQKPISKISMKKMFKRNSIITLAIFSTIIIILCLFYSTNNKLYYLKIADCINLGCLWQSITLTDHGKAVFKKVDSVLKNIGERRKIN
ncbi:MULTISPECIES: accessory gene regulator ArgB-like protein [Clostridium]|uniref:Accessory gene regulator ArgB-like protein n=1 Tax=Clostridium lapidicellarium TaxID=3240931 RepID=A0ABV4DZ95_9CLOT